MKGKKLLIHCSYHKCLTSYFSKVMSLIFNKIHPLKPGYKHFDSKIDEFYENLNKYKIMSVNNHSLDFSLLGDKFKITRFIRDPRDLVVSGYFYHKRNAEMWCGIVNPTENDYDLVNGSVPSGISDGDSYSSYLRNLSLEEGLIAEIEFRKKHYESMLKWPDNDPRIKIFKYEDIIGNEKNVFKKISEFYVISFIMSKKGDLGLRDSKICLLQGDCLQVMAQIPDKSIHMILTDPP